MRETDAILQSLLYQVEKAATVEQCRNAVRVMCNKDNLDAVKVRLTEEREQEEHSPGSKKN